ncbi:hypothetical protein OG21DRAFT_1184612 [Imleria badia]|nr:hypothetical protein OG21DRAFT_1184612 [Imleria badia]
MLSELFRRRLLPQPMTHMHHSLQGFSNKASAIVDLLAPGIPEYLAESSSTSGGLPKTFAKYNRSSKVRSLDPRPRTVSNATRRRTRAYI